MENQIRPQAQCMGCEKYPPQIGEYVDSAIAANEITGAENCILCGAEPGTPHLETCANYLTADDYVWLEEGTINEANGHFLCTACYISAGMPSSPTGWITP
jgi:hypothetical protein